MNCVSSSYSFSLHDVLVAVVARIVADEVIVDVLVFVDGRMLARSLSCSERGGGLCYARN